jgi:hypothetical protein
MTDEFGFIAIKEHSKFAHDHAISILTIDKIIGVFSILITTDC